MERFLDVMDGGFERSRGRGVFQIAFGGLLAAVSLYWFYQGASQPAFGQTAALLGLVLLALGVEGLARGAARLSRPDRTSLVSALRLVGIVAWIACVVTITAALYLFFGLTVAAVFVAAFLAVWVLARLILRNRARPQAPRP